MKLYPQVLRRDKEQCVRVHVYDGCDVGQQDLSMAAQTIVFTSTHSDLLQHNSTTEIQQLLPFANPLSRIRWQMLAAGCICGQR